MRQRDEEFQAAQTFEFSYDLLKLATDWGWRVTDDGYSMRRETYFDEQAKVMGYMLIEWGGLEVRVGKLIARLLGQQDDWIAAIFAAELMFLPKLRLARSLLKAKIPDDDKRRPFEEALRKAETCNQKRNEYVHSDYSISDHGRNIDLAKIVFRKAPISMELMLVIGPVPFCKRWRKQN